MVKHIYVTTDELQAETYAGEDEHFRGLRIKPIKYVEFGFGEGHELTEELGFVPMTRIDFDDSVTEAHLQMIARRMVKENFCVAVESGGGVEPFIPRDLGLRTAIVENSLRPRNSDDFYAFARFGLDLIQYSNAEDPLKVKDFCGMASRV